MRCERYWEYLDVDGRIHRSSVSSFYRVIRKRISCGIHRTHTEWVDYSENVLDITDFLMRGLEHLCKQVANPQCGRNKHGSL